MPQKSLMVLGIDPGYDRCGFGIIKGSGMDWAHVAHGVVTTSKEETHAERLAELARDMEVIFEKYRIDLMVIEELFFAKSTTTALKVAEARGVLRMLAARQGIEVIEVKPNEVKLAMTGHGRADKKQIQEMVKMALKLRQIPKPDDAADALGIALTGAGKARFSSK